MAVKKNATIVSFIDAQAGFPVVVGGAKGRPASGSAADLAEPVEELGDIRPGLHRPGHFAAPLARRSADSRRKLSESEPWGDRQ